MIGFFQREFHKFVNSKLCHEFEFKEINENNLKIDCKNIANITKIT